MSNLNNSYDDPDYFDKGTSSPNTSPSKKLEFSSTQVALDDFKEKINDPLYHKSDIKVRSLGYVKE